ncbi:6-phospho-beta-glucosidase [Phaeacidiphilus oryzae]|jgi:6-phospho-beta-glucosidase|uniref:6-phospho-beta-glucosidase n=1 Tax=Phaeacidiphilus oryzae TaxID=348818 RepID=UPI000561835C|nr:6-phospho-beta-glucosidase [Phaeacidiphilus oryzae]
MKLCILGGGGFRVPYVYRALLGDGGEPRVDDVWLYDTDSERLEAVQRILAELAEGHPDAPRVSATTVLDDALEGADFVFCAVRVGGLAGRTQDERVALELGVLGQETTGPGGLAYGLRTLPVMRRFAERVRAVAPGAFVINFTNPAGMITEAMQSVLGDRVVGICDTPSGLGRRVARALGADPAAARLDYIGLNHLGWLRRLELDGRDRLPELLADDEKLGSLEETEVFGPEWIRTMGLLPNEYLYYYYFNRDAVRAILDAPRTRGEFLVEQQTAFFRQARGLSCGAERLWRRTIAERSASYMAEAKDGVEHGEAPAAGAGSPTDEAPEPEIDGYAGVALALMNAIARDEPASMVLNVRNGPIVPSLPADAVIEVPCTVDAKGPRPQPVTAPDLSQLGLMQQVKACERLTVRAAFEQDPDAALQAFALHPLVDSVSVARRLLDGYRTRIPEVAEALGGR